MRVTPDEYERLDLRAHALLADVPLHDVWTVDLAGGGADRTILDVMALLPVGELGRTNVAVRFLFGLRTQLGRVFGWDREPPRTSDNSFLRRLSDADRERSLVVPGTQDGPFQVLFVSPREAISEIQNATVHAFLVFALQERSTGYRLFWAIYVKPVGRLTRWYMRLIDPFRRVIIYPAILRHIEAGWARGETRGGRGGT